MIIEIVFFPISVKNNSLLDAYNNLFFSAAFLAPHTTRLYTIKSPDVVQYWFMEPGTYNPELFELNESVKYVSRLIKYDYITYDDVLQKKQSIINLLSNQPYTFR